MAEVRFRRFVAPAQPGKDVLQVLLEAGADIGFLCMGGTCGTCRVRVVAGAEHLEPLAPGERHHCPPGSGCRLACQALLRGTGDVVVEQ